MKSNILEWLSLMRHYGAPTRLLDWTYSFFIALYFAAESAEGDFAVWAIDVRWCNTQSKLRLAKAGVSDVDHRICRDPHYQKIETFKLLFCREPPEPLVSRINPFVLNQRLAVQKGLFLCPGDVSQTFESNLEDLPDSESPVIKMTLDESLHREVLRRLHYMNIARDTLFPDLGGLAQSLTGRLIVPEVLVPGYRKRLGVGPFAGWGEE